MTSQPFVLRDGAVVLEGMLRARCRTETDAKRAMHRGRRARISASTNRAERLLLQLAGRRFRLARDTNNPALSLVRVLAAIPKGDAFDLAQIATGAI